MKEIEYKDSKKLGLKIFEESNGFTVLRKAPKVKVRKSHGKKYPQFYNSNLNVVYETMIKWLVANRD